MKLFPYQNAAATKIAASKLATYNVFDPGLGKSCTALDVAKRINARRVLITGPMTATYSWRLELKKFWPDHPPFKVIKTMGDMAAFRNDGVFYVTYGLLSRSMAIVDQVMAVPAFDLSILDESHALKNSGAARTRAVLSRKTGFRDNLGLAHPMSATPAPNHAGELWPILASLRPDLIMENGKPMTKTAFEDRYCEKQTMRVNERMIEVITGSKNVPELRRRLDGFFLRETKANVMKDLPPLRFTTHPVQIANPEYFATVSQLVESGIKDDEVLKHAAMMANSTRYAELGMAKAQQAAELVHDLLDGGVRQIVVWAIHTPVIDYLCKNLLDVGVSRLDGGVSQRDRDNAIGDFLSGANRVFVGQIEAGGAAITLSGGKLQCSDALFVESHFSPKLNWQAACRIHRIGQHDAVLARFLSAVGTYDERLQEIQARKTQDFADLFDKEDVL
jgi:SNF2 family DNA or RNA helicase